jgi:hypothetical protein
MLEQRCDRSVATKVTARSRTTEKKHEKNLRSAATIGLIASGLTIGIVESVGAIPDESQRLRGLAGRVFAIHGEYLNSMPPAPPVGFEFDNCYYFNADGVWLDPKFPDPGNPGNMPENPAVVPGTWIQHTNGAKTSYTALAELPGILNLVQNGTVTPAGGRGTLQFEAYSTVLLFGEVIAEIVSLGHEVDECPFEQ